MFDQHNVRATAGDNTDKGHTHSPTTEIKISDPAKNRTRVRTDGFYRPRHDDGHMLVTLNYKGWI